MPRITNVGELDWKIPDPTVLRKEQFLDLVIFGTDLEGDSGILYHADAQISELELVVLLDKTHHRPLPYHFECGTYENGEFSGISIIEKPNGEESLGEAEEVSNLCLPLRKALKALSRRYPTAVVLYDLHQELPEIVIISLWQFPGEIKNPDESFIASLAHNMGIWAWQ